MLPPPPQNFILFELDFNVKFPLICLFIFQSELKSTILTTIEYILNAKKNCFLGFTLKLELIRKKL